MLLIGPSGTIEIEKHIFSITKMHMKMPSAKWPECDDVFVVNFNVIPNTNSQVSLSTELLLYEILRRSESKDHFAKIRLHCKFVEFYLLQVPRLCTPRYLRTYMFMNNPAVCDTLYKCDAHINLHRQMKGLYTNGSGVDSLLFIRIIRCNL